MTPERYKLISTYCDDKTYLSDEEYAEGWHFCPEWDDLLIDPKSPEFDACVCDDHKHHKAK